MKKKLKKLQTILLIIIFPLGVLYCILHTLGYDLCTFLGSIFLLAIGILLGIYIVEPQLIQSWFEWLTIIKN